MSVCVLCVLCLSKPLSEVGVGVTYYALSLSVLCVCFTPSCSLFHLNHSTVLQQVSQDVACLVVVMLVTKMVLRNYDICETIRVNRMG